MDSMLLVNYGIDYKAGVTRFLEDEEMYKAMLAEFVKDDRSDVLNDLMRAKDYKTLLAEAHQIKGVSGNMDMYALFDAASYLVNELRANPVSDAAIAKDFDVFINAYARVMQGLQLYFGL